MINPSAIDGPRKASPAVQLSSADAAVIETFVVPRYLSLYGELALQLYLPGKSARIAHLGCRTGYLDRQLCERAPTATLLGIDGSAAALELARNKARVLADKRIQYQEGDSVDTGLPDHSFSHVVSLHPVLAKGQRQALFAEAFRLLYGSGQLIVALPLRGSFQEIGDLLKEFALKFDDTRFGTAVEQAMHVRPTIETLSEEIESAGLDDVDVEIRQTTLAFDSGRAFLEDPVSRLLVQPELQLEIGVTDLARPFDYVREAIDKYWSQTKFELSVNVGCASARKFS